MNVMERCRDVTGALGDALFWVGRSGDERVLEEARSLTRQLRRAQIRARKLTEAADRPMAVSVFGPSQAGKSYLMSVLARPDGGELLTAWDDPGGELNFIRDINPEGDKESTGIVTRFTMKRDASPAGFPIRLRLLSEADIARILVNSFLSEGDRSEEEPTEKEIEDLIAAFRPRATGAPGQGFTEDDAIEVQEYFFPRFDKELYVRALAPFFDDAIQIAPRLSVADRAEFLSIIWGRHRAFTDLYRQLGEALASIGNAADIFAGMDALQPRKQSIVDVARLRELDDGSANPLRVATAQGREVELPRSIVTALIAEMALPLKEQPHDFFKSTDLLDFPGARSRQRVFLERHLTGRGEDDGESDAKRRGKAMKALSDCLLRGKVAFLFDRYVAEQEITSMLLCTPDSVQDVTGLPELITEWIHHTHGASPVERANARNLLFFVLTKFDMHLGQKAGADDDTSTRFENRMFSSFENFEKGSDWVTDWTPGQPFRTCYLLRNPNFGRIPLFSYEEAGKDAAGKPVHREASIDPGMKDFAESLKEGFARSERVRRHFGEPAAAFDAMMALNDGGVKRIVDGLTEVCRPETKAGQISERIEALAAQADALLDPFFESSDLEQLLEKRRAECTELLTELRVVFQRSRFGALLDALSVRPEEFETLMARPPADIRIVAGPAPATLDGALDDPFAGAMLPGGVSLDLAPETDAEQAGDGPRALTRAAWRAEAALEVWINRIDSFAARDDAAAVLGLSRKSATHLARQLKNAAHRLKIREMLERDLHPDRVVAANDGAAAVIAATLFNDFTATAGASLTPEEKLPEYQTAQGPARAFALKPQIDGPETLPERPLPVLAGAMLNYSWMLNMLFEDDARFAGGDTIDVESNSQLGLVLKQLRMPQEDAA